MMMIILIMILIMMKMMFMMMILILMMMMLMCHSENHFANIQKGHRSKHSSFLLVPLSLYISYHLYFFNITITLR